MLEKQKIIKIIMFNFMLANHKDQRMNSSLTLSQVYANSKNYYVIPLIFNLQKKIKI